MDQEDPQAMTPEAAKAFEIAAAKEKGRILNAVRNPQAEFLTGYYLLHKSDLVVKAMAKLVARDEADKVEAFLASDPRRVETLAERGQAAALFDVLETLGKSQQARILSATESENYGAPNATVLQTLAAEKDPQLQERLAKMLRGLDGAQCTKLFSAPGAAWWLSSYGRGDLLTELMGTLSPKQRQYIVNHSGDMARTISATCRDDLTALFRDCKFPKPSKRAAPKPA